MQEANFRGLVSLGIGAVGGSPVASYREADVQRFTSIVQSHPDAAATQAGHLKFLIAVCMHCVNNQTDSA